MGSDPHQQRRLRLLLAGVMLAGAMIRVVQYAMCRSLWVDEAMLALSVGMRDYAGLLHPLLYDQIAPTLFLFGSKLSVTIGGTNELSLRLVPLIAGVGALGVVARMGPSMVGPVAAIIGLALLAASPSPVYYSQEFKPYAVEMAYAALVLATANAAMQGKSRVATACWLCGLGVIGPWISASAIIVVLGVCGCLFIRACARRRWIDLRLPIYVGTASLVSFYPAYRVVYGVAARGEYIRSFWQDSYITLAGSDGIRRNVVLVERVLWGTFVGKPPAAIQWPIAPVVGDIVWHAVSLVLVTLVGYGVIRLWQHGRGWQAALLLAPALALAAVSAAGVYPIATRFALFVVPGIALLMGVALESLAMSMPLRNPLLGASVLAVPIVAMGCPANGRWRLSDDQWSRARQVTTWARDGSNYTYVYSRGVPQYLFYATDWSEPNRATVDVAHMLTRPGSTAFENRPTLTTLVAQDSVLLRNLVQRGIILGLPDGLSFRYMTGWNRLAPDSVWAVSEVARMSAVAKGGPLGVVILHNIDASGFLLARELARQGWRCATYGPFSRELGLRCRRPTGAIGARGSL